MHNKLALSCNVNNTNLFEKTYSVYTYLDPKKMKSILKFETAIWYSSIQQFQFINLNIMSLKSLPTFAVENLLSLTRTHFLRYLQISVNITTNGFFPLRRI